MDRLLLGHLCAPLHWRHGPYEMFKICQVCVKAQVCRAEKEKENLKRKMNRNKDKNRIESIQKDGHDWWGSIADWFWIQERCSFLPRLASTLLFVQSWTDTPSGFDLSMPEGYLSEMIAPRYLKLDTAPSLCPFTTITSSMPLWLLVISVVFSKLLSMSSCHTFCDAWSRFFSPCSSLTNASMSSAKRRWLFVLQNWRCQHMVIQGIWNNPFQKDIVVWVWSQSDSWFTTISWIW